jgi:hypothetical protein
MDPLLKKLFSTQAAFQIFEGITLLTVASQKVSSL